jgi:hypothetical protein
VLLWGSRDGGAKALTPVGRGERLQTESRVIGLTVSDVPERAAEAASAMRELVEKIVKALVDRPEAVEISEIAGNHAHVLELKVAKEDLGKVIGKGGAHASAIRTILAAASGKENKRYILEIIE